MIGREVARRAAGSVLASALTGRGRLLLISGEAGIGKSTLARSIADDAAAAGAEVRWGACWEGGSLLPFTAWIDALRRPGGDACAEVAARLADGTDAAPDAGAGTAARARARRFVEVVDALAHGAAARPQVVVLEDLHWADAPSLELLRAVAPHLPSTAALVVATYRDDELDPAALAGLGGAAEWLTLHGLLEPEVADLLGEVLDRVPAPAEVAAVRERTGGNPLFVAQVGRLLATGSPGTAAANAVPAGVREVLARRLARLSAEGDRVLAVASVLGTTFDVRDLAAVAGRPEDEITAHLDEAARARLAQPTRSSADRWSFAHDLVRATRYEALGAGEQAELHRRAVDVLATRSSTPAGVLAHHAALARFDTGDVRPASLAVAAAQEALARMAWPEALALCERAVAAAPDSEDGDRWRIEALLAAGAAHLRRGDGDAAASFEAAAAVARAHGWWDDLARAALGFAADLAGFEVPLLEPHQIALLEEAAAVLHEGSPLRPLVLARLSIALALTGVEDRRLALADEAVQLARAGGDVATMAATIAARCDAIAGPDHVAERLGAATEVVALAQRTGDLGLELLGRRHRVVALLELRDRAGFEAEVAAFGRSAALLGDPLYSWYVPLWRAMQAHAEGRLDDAVALASEAGALGAAGGSTNAVMLEHVVRLMVEVDRGDVDAFVERWKAIADDQVWAMPSLLLDISRSWISAEAGDLDAAAAALARMRPEDLERVPRDQEWLPYLAQLVTGAAAVGDRPLLQAGHDLLLPYAGLGCFEGLAAADRGVVERQLVLAAGHLGDLEAVERHAPVALRDGAAAGALVAAATTADCARAYAAAGDPASAATLAADAIARYEGLGLARKAEALRALVGGAPSPSANAGTPSLVREGDAWAVTWGGTTVRVRHAKGIADLAVLLAHRSEPVHVRTLEGVDDLLTASDQPALDRTAVAAYRTRLRDLEDDLDEADRHADLERAARLGAERDALVAELTRGLGLGGRPRGAGSDPDERLRKAVSARVKATIDRLEALQPGLGRHLRGAVRTGYWCTYEPEQPVTWRVEGDRSG